jgi:hypothetical protein
MNHIAKLVVSVLVTASSRRSVHFSKGSEIVNTCRCGHKMFQSFGGKERGSGGERDGV